MRCLFPLHGWYSSKRNPSGKRSIVFKVRDGLCDRPISVPCGQCINCRLEKSRMWAVRCMHESQMYEANCFVTVTYDDEHLPVGGSLFRPDFQDFLKRLRRRYASKRIRVFYCGEYGEQFGRPHFHAILFGFDFPDKVLLGKRKGLPYWRSAVLESLWTFGRSEIGSVTFESAAYVARYVTKKITGDAAVLHYGGRKPEFAGMSLQNGGIGLPWFRKYEAEVKARGDVVVRGKAVSVPRAYMKALEESGDPAFLKLKSQRLALAVARLRSIDGSRHLTDAEVLFCASAIDPDGSSSRAEVIEEVALARSNFFSRELK